MEEPNSATPTTNLMPTPAVTVKPAPEQEKVPHSALPRSKLSINSPIFTPTWESKGPHSAIPAIVPSPVPEGPAPTEIVEAPVGPVVTYNVSS